MISKHWVPVVLALLIGPQIQHAALANPPAGTAERQLDRSASDPDLYSASLDTEVTYDDLLARHLDGGYDPLAYQQFESALAAYGSWIDDSSFGRVWSPARAIVGDDFSPYFTNGHWVLTEYGWTWESGWDWGWAPFHYGRWIVRGDDQWFWVPGTIWAPAWVAWRNGRSYAAWAPLPPRGVPLARPIGRRSPWRMARNRRLDTAAVEYVAPRDIPALFGRTTAVSNTRTLVMNDVSARVTVGPDASTCGKGRRLDPLPLATAAPHSVPRLTIVPHPGPTTAALPWVVAGVREQAPIVPWGASDHADSVRQARSM